MVLSYRRQHVLLHLIGNESHTEAVLKGSARPAHEIIPPRVHKEDIQAVQAAKSWPWKGMLQIHKTGKFTWEELRKIFG